MEPDEIAMAGTIIILFMCGYLSCKITAWIEREKDRILYDPARNIDRIRAEKGGW